MALGQEESIGFLMAECPMSHLVLLTLAPNVATTAGPNCFIILLLFLFLLSTPQRELFFRKRMCSIHVGAFSICMVNKLVVDE